MTSQKKHHYFGTRNKWQCVHKSGMSMARSHKYTKNCTEEYEPIACPLAALHAFKLKALSTRPVSKLTKGYPCPALLIISLEITGDSLAL